MWVLIVAIILLLGSIVLFFLMADAYKTKPVAHSSTPEKIGIIFDEVWFTTAKSLNLYGWWIPVNGESSKPILILVHGWRRNVERMMPYIKELHPDFNLLVFDARNHGKSDFDGIATMPKFTEDILAAVDYVYSRTEIAKKEIGVLGLSMGGSAAIYAASRDSRIKSVVTVGAFANPEEIMQLEFKKRHIPYFPFVYIFLKYVEHKIGIKFNTFAPERHVQNIKGKLLLIHGSDDITAPINQAQKLFHASQKENTELWIIDGAGHSDCHKFQGFWDRILKFMGGSFKK